LKGREVFHFVAPLEDRLKKDICQPLEKFVNVKDEGLYLSISPIWQNLVHLSPIKEDENTSQPWRPKVIPFEMELPTCRSWYKLNLCWLGQSLDLHLDI